VAVEVAHDMDEDEYVFETFFEDPSAWNSNAEAQSLREDAHKNLANGLRSRFQQFPKAMLAAHGKDLLADADDAPSSNAGSGASTPAVAQTTSNVASSSTSSQAPSQPVQAAPKAPAKGVRTAKVRTEGEFMIVRTSSLA
jgi:activator of HSP90 ATPase